MGLETLTVRFFGHDCEPLRRRRKKQAFDVASIPPDDAEEDDDQKEKLTQEATVIAHGHFSVTCPKEQENDPRHCEAYIFPPVISDLSRLERGIREAIKKAIVNRKKHKIRSLLLKEKSILAEGRLTINYGTQDVDIQLLPPKKESKKSKLESEQEKRKHDEILSEIARRVKQAVQNLIFPQST